MAALLTLLSVALPFVAAIPSVTPVQVGAGTCQYFPNYYPSPESDTTGGFLFRPDQADNSTIDGLYTSLEATNEDVFDITTRTDLAKSLYGCSDGLVHFYIGTSPPEVFISPTTGELGYLGAGLVPESYHHQVDGATQDGVFLGSGGVTAWAYTFVPGGGLIGEDVFTMRLLESQDGALNDGEFYGFLKAVGV